MDSTIETHTTDASAADQLKKRKLRMGIALVVIAVVAGVSGMVVSRSGGHSKKSGLSAKIHEVWQVYGHAWISVQDKIEALQKSDEENERLRKENAHLRLVLESEKYEKYAERAQKETQAFQWKLSKTTGSRTGRTLASISYKIPQDLLPSQLFSLGLSYFKMREDEKAAVIFTFLTGLEGDSTFKTPSNHLLTGIAWYRLENFELADFYFDQVLHSTENQATRRFHGQARLWKGLIAERTGKHVKAQFWLRDVLDHDPHSLEARWVNSALASEEHAPAEEEGDRVPAHEAESEKAAEAEHGAVKEHSEHSADSAHSAHQKAQGEAHEAHSHH
jgi:tetratricopeptide (TPR) repeat protein